MDDAQGTVLHEPEPRTEEKQKRRVRVPQTALRAGFFFGGALLIGAGLWAVYGEWGWACIVLGVACIAEAVL